MTEERGLESWSESINGLLEAEAQDYQGLYRPVLDLQAAAEAGHGIQNA